MDNKFLVEQELHKIHQKRNRLGYLTNPLAFFLSLYFQGENLVVDTRWILAVTFLVLGTLLRVLIGETFYDAWKNKVPWARVTSFFAMLFLGGGWSFHFWDVHFHYGTESNHVTYTLLIIAAFITGSSSSLIADKVSYYTFVISLSVGALASFLMDPVWSNTFIIINIILYLAFSIGNYRLSYKQLVDLTESNIRSIQEAERLKNIIDTVPGFVGLFDKNLVCYMANQATLGLYPDILGSKIGRLDPNSTWEASVIDFMSSDKVSEISEQHTKYKGKDLYALLNVQKTVDGGAIVVSIIMTELVEARKRLREQEAKAQYTARLASLGEMAAGIAHEINNPLTIIQGSANILRRIVDSEPLDKDTTKLMAQKISETSDRISKTVKSLKALSRNGENDPLVVVSVPHMLKLCVDISETRFRQNNVELRLPEKIPDWHVIGREVQLSQVLVNLMINALDAIKNLPEKWVEIKLVKGDKVVDIFVIDSGHGIPPEIRSKIMDPFFTTKDVNEGTGLGLSISKTILKDHHGELTLLENEPRTTFRVRIPSEETPLG